MATNLKVGDKVIYKGEEWEVGFINQLSLRGTLRLQKSGMSDARQVNRVYPEDVVRGFLIIRTPEQEKAHKAYLESLKGGND